MGRRQPTSPSVFGCLTESPLMLNAMLPGHPMPVACFVKTKKMNINVIQTESCSKGRQSKGFNCRFLDLLYRVYSGGSNAAARHALSINMQRNVVSLFPCLWGITPHGVSNQINMTYIGKNTDLKNNYNSKEVRTLCFVKIKQNAITCK